MQEGEKNETACCLRYSLEPSSGSHFPFRYATWLQVLEGGGIVSWSAADLYPQEIIQGAFVEEQANPFLHLSRLEFVHTLSEMQKYWNLCSHGAAFLKLAYFFTGNFC